MAKYICAGTIVHDTKSNKIGEVVATNPGMKFAVVQGRQSFWTQKFCNLKVNSYKEVK